MAAESGARQSLSAQHPNLLQWVLMMHLLMLTCPRPHRPPMWSSSGTALRWDLLQTPSTLRGLRPYVAFSLHLGRLRVPSARRGTGDGHDAIRAGHFEIPRGQGAIQMQSVIIFPRLKQRPEKG